MHTRSKSGIVKPKVYTVSRHPLAITSGPREPDTVKQALADKDWRSAMQAELHALNRNQAWSLVLAPHIQKQIGNKWIFKVKCLPSGVVQ